MTTTYPTQTDLNALAYERFSAKVDRTASAVTAAYIGHQLTPLIQRHATPTELIAALRHIVDHIESTGIR